MSNDLKNEWKRLCKQIKLYNQKYEEGMPLIEDNLYDLLIDRLKYIEGIIGSQKNSPLYQVRTEIGEKKIEHSKPILSLDHGFGIPSIGVFLEKIARLNKNEDFFPLIGEYKIDGISLILRYENGNITALTRGNGVKGINVSEKIKFIDIPRNIDQNLEVRGELYMSFNEFEKIKNDFSSPRNACAAIIQNKYPMSHLKANFVAHEIINKKFDTYKESMEYLKNLGFDVLNNKICSNKEDCINFFQESLNHRSEMPHPIDGVVFKINNTEIANSLGYHETAPRSAFAVKFDAIAKETTIRKIEVQVGKFGNLTPVAVFDTVLIDGHNIKKATIHNFDELNKNGYGVGDGILINRSGDVVPYISAKYYDAKTPFKIEACPSCGSQVYEYQKTLVCKNKWNCTAQKIGKIEHFCSKNAFNIEGIASSTIASFVENGFIEKPVDIFALPEKIKSKEIFLGEGWKSKSIQNLVNSIEQSRKINLSNFLFALCMPNVGLGISRKIAKNFDSFEDFYVNYTSEEPKKIYSVGDVMITSIREFLLSKDENWIFELKKIVKII